MSADSPGINPRKLAYTFPEAREATTFSRQWWYKIESQGHIRLIRVGSKTLVPLSAIDAVLSGRLDIKDKHRAQHWRGQKLSPKRRPGRPRIYPKPEPAPSTAAAMPTRAQPPPPQERKRPHGDEPGRAGRDGGQQQDDDEQDYKAS
jgi:hypothetical protein